MLGAAAGHWIAINDQTVARLKNDKHAVIRAKVEAGKHYYAWLDYGKMMARVRLTPVASSESADLQKWLKKTSYVSLNPQALTDRIRDREKIVTDFLHEAIDRANSGAALSL